MSDFVTGANGFVGSHLIDRLAGEKNTVWALARSGSSTAAERIESALAEVGGSATAAAVTAVAGDVTELDCGLGKEEIDAIRGGEDPLTFWHVAASLRWEPGKRDLIYETNVEGTRNALRLAKRLDALLFVYVSTAYTCGALVGAIPEELHEPPGFNNLYEESKGAAERLVLDFAAEEGMRCVIMRPSIVVGTLRDYRASGSYTGLYGLIREVRRFQEMAGDSTETARVEVNCDAVLPFIAVDHVIEDMLVARDRELTAPGQPIYHVTAQIDEGCPTLGELGNYIIERLGASDSIRIVDGRIEEPTPIERLLAKRLAFFSGYLRAQRDFTRTLEGSRWLSAEDVKRFVDSEIETRAGGSSVATSVSR